MEKLKYRMRVGIMLILLTAMAAVGVCMSQVKPKASNVIMVR